MRLAAAIAAEKLDEFGDPVPAFHQSPTQPVKSRASAKRKRTADDVDTTDTEDKTFAASATEDGSDEDSDAMEVSNEEVCHN
jgi:hypothetical protein